MIDCKQKVIVRKDACMGTKEQVCVGEGITDLSLYQRFVPLSAFLPCPAAEEIARRSAAHPSS